MNNSIIPIIRELHHNTININGKKFGRLFVIEYTKNRTSAGLVLWKCKCDCGKIIMVSGHNLRLNLTKSCGCLNRELRKKRIGKNHPSWKGGISKNKKHLKNIQLKCRYGISTKMYNKLLNIQKGKCAICKQQLNNKLQIDHDHRTRKVRGLLCRNCNWLLGLAKDKIMILINSIKYLKCNNTFEVKE